MTILFNTIYLTEGEFLMSHCMKTLYKSMCSESEAVIVGLLSYSPRLLPSSHQGRSKAHASGSCLTGDDQQENSKPAFHLDILVTFSAFIVQISKYIKTLFKKQVIQVT